MDVRSVATLSVLIGVVASAVWLSSELDVIAAGESGAVSAALVAHLEGFIEESELQNPPADMVGDLVLCLDANTKIDVAAVNRGLAGTLVRVIPAKRCTSKAVEGDFGMFTGLIDWYDESGEEAFYLEIAAVHCPTVRRCVVDIETPMRDDRYEVERSGRKWTVAKSKMLRVV